MSSMRVSIPHAGLMVYVNSSNPIMGDNVPKATESMEFWIPNPNNVKKPVIRVLGPSPETWNITIGRTVHSMWKRSSIVLFGLFRTYPNTQMAHTLPKVPISRLL